MCKWNLSFSVPNFSPRGGKLKIIKAPWRVRLSATTTHDYGLHCCQRAKQLAVQMRAHSTVVGSERFQDFSVLSFQMFRKGLMEMFVRPNFGYSSARVWSFLWWSGFLSLRAKTEVATANTKMCSLLVFSDHFDDFFQKWKGMFQGGFSALRGQFEGPLSRGGVFSIALCEKTTSFEEISFLEFLLPLKNLQVWVALNWEASTAREYLRLGKTATLKHLAYSVSLTSPENWGFLIYFGSKVLIFTTFWYKSFIKFDETLPFLPETARNAITEIHLRQPGRNPGVRKVFCPVPPPS